MRQKRELIDTKRLLDKVGSLVDPVLQAIPEKPKFCFNSGKQLRLLDADTISGMETSAQDCRDLILTIDASGPTGIGYVLTALPENEDPAIIAADKVLNAWHAQFPMDKYLNIEEERERQLELYFHERILDSIDQFFDKCVWDALPEEVRQISMLEKQLRECQDDLDALAEGEDDKNIQVERAQLQEQLDSTKAIRDTLNLLEIKTKALIHAQVGIAIGIAEQKKWSELLNFDQEDPAHILNEEQLTALVSQAVDALSPRTYVLHDKEEQGPLAKHLAARRELQNEKRSNAEGSLRTQATINGETHQLSLTEIRDPLNRALFIDTATSSEGEKFLDITVGACLSVDQEVPTIIKEFVDLKMETDKIYPDKAQLRYNQFITNKLQLPPEQMAILEDFGIHNLPYSLASTRLSLHLENFGLHKKTRSLDELNVFERNKIPKFADPWTP